MRPRGFGRGVAIAEPAATFELHGRSRDHARQLTAAVWAGRNLRIREFLYLLRVPFALRAFILVKRHKLPRLSRLQFHKANALDRFHLA